MKSIHPVHEGFLLLPLHEEHAKHNAGESTPINFSIEPTMNQP